MTIWAKVTAQFEALHYWMDAIPEVDFLKHPHRHVFHVTLWIEQKHEERDIEYILLKRHLSELLNKTYANNLNGKSCETMALEIKEVMETDYPKRKVMVEVTEDGENGALID